MGQSVRTKSNTTTLPSDELKGSKALPSRFSAPAPCSVCGTRGCAPTMQNKNIAQIILRAGICERYMAAGNPPCKQLQFYTLRTNTPIAVCRRAIPIPHFVGLPQFSEGLQVRYMKSLAHL